MKRNIFLLVFCLQSSVIGLSFAQTKVGKVDNVMGEVTIAHEAGKKKEKAVVGTVLFLKDIVETKKESSVQLALDDGTGIVLREKTKIVVSEFIFNPGKKQRETILDVAGGKLKVIVSKTFNKKTSKTEFKTPTAVVGVRGTELALDVGKKKTSVFCLKGMVETFNPLHPTDVVAIRAGKFTSVLSGKLPEAPVPIPREMLDTIEGQFGFPTSVESLKEQGLDSLKSRLPFP